MSVIDASFPLTVGARIKLAVVGLCENRGGIFFAVLKWEGRIGNTYLIAI
jgi:hypothetical protein